MELQSFIATGDINVSRFLMADTTADFAVKQADAQESKLVIGIAQPGTRDAQIPSVSNQLAAANGETLQVRQWGVYCEVMVGTGGVTRNTWCTNAADGRCILPSAAGLVTMFFAQQTRAAGELVRGWFVAPAIRDA